MRQSLRLVSVVALVTVLGIVGSAQGAVSWDIPATAPREKNPLASDPDLPARGKALYASQCQRCHGLDGKNDGPDANQDEMTADLTDGARVSINPDGVVFYKIWNGRFRPAMPAFGRGLSNGRQAAPGTLSREEVWALVAYVQTLRKP